uniref:Outer membrane protein W n=1 Tax=Haliea sp. ETY-M TaxID=1055105 RepID=A0A455R1U5_9GAMM|nr:outer membrane protein W precursor [Haliea sp. ETY-M]
MQTQKKLNCSGALLLGAAAVVSTPAAAYEAGDILFRTGAVVVAPDESSDGIAIPALGVPPIEGTGVEIDNDTQLTLMATYMFSDSLGIELLAATPFTHNITADLRAAGYGKVPVGEATHLPPTLSAVWYPLGSASALSPYVGIGVNYTVFIDEDVSSALEGAVPIVANDIAGIDLGESVPLSMDLDSSVGIAFQLGVDYNLNDKWHVNASARWIDIETDAKITNRDLGTVITVDNVKIDPWVYQLNIGYRF